MNQNENLNFDELLPGLQEKSIPEILAVMPNKQLMKAYYVLKTNPQKTQELVLLDILKYAQNSRIGKKEAFADIKTVEDFRQKLPVTEYRDYLPYIEPMAKGETDIQYNGETVRFIATSGTTGIAKLIPESNNGETVKALVSKIRLIFLVSLAPEIMMPDKKVLSITNPSEYSKTEGNIPIGSASGQAVKDIPKELQQKLLLPVELILAKNISNEAMDYLVLLLALAEENLAGVVCSNIAHFNILLNKAQDCSEDLLADIKKGEISAGIEMDPGLREQLTSRLTPNPARAEALKAILDSNQPLDVQRIWPYFSVVSCWMAASAERIALDVSKRLPKETRFLEWGYGASEGKFNIPSLVNDSSGDLALFGYFFEFLPIGKTDTLLAHELKEGEYYELIITTYSGLYRYNMKDIVYVKSMEGGSPRIVFAAKTTECLQLNDVELFVYEIDALLKEACGQIDDEIRFYQIIADENEKKLVFIAEPAGDAFDGKVCIHAIENILRSRHPLYNRNRENGRIRAAEMIVMKQGYRDSLFARSIMPGKNVNQTKLKTIIDAYPESGSMINRYGGENE